MASVRDELNAKIAAAAETKTATWLELETQSVKEFFALLGKHL